MDNAEVCMRILQWNYNGLISLVSAARPMKKLDSLELLKQQHAEVLRFVCMVMLSCGASCLAMEELARNG